jgi:hypothetical protein
MLYQLHRLFRVKLYDSTNTFFEIERIMEEVVMTYFKVPPLHSPVGTEENHKNLSQES